MEPGARLGAGARSPSSRALGSSAPRLFRSRLFYGRCVGFVYSPGWPSRKLSRCQTQSQLNLATSSHCWLLPSWAEPGRRGHGCAAGLAGAALSHGMRSAVLSLLPYLGHPLLCGFLFIYLFISPSSLPHTIFPPAAPSPGGADAEPGAGAGVLAGTPRLGPVPEEIASASAYVYKYIYV